MDSRVRGPLSYFRTMGRVGLLDICSFGLGVLLGLKAIWLLILLLIGYFVYAATQWLKIYHYETYLRVFHKQMYRELRRKAQVYKALEDLYYAKTPGEFNNAKLQAHRVLAGIRDWRREL